MNKFKKQPANNNKIFHYINNNIRANTVFCIDKDNEKIGAIDIRDALKLAEEAKLDLVQFSSADVPTCRIIDYSKFKYELSKKEKLSKKKQRESSVKIKEIKFRPSTGIEDLRVKATKAIKNLEDGYRIKILIVFKGREMSYTKIAEETMNTFISLIPDLEIIEPPAIYGRYLSAMGMKKVGRLSGSGNPE